MKCKLLIAAVSSALLFATGALADGGPEPEAPPPPPPAPAPEPEPEPAPVYEPAPAPEYHWYTTIFAGTAFGGELERTVDFGPNEVFTDEVPLHTGYLLGWTLGYDDLLGGETIGLRPEAELSFRQRDIDFEEWFREPIDFTQPVDVLSLMANLWIDFKMNGITPYVGGGVGIGWADLPAGESAMIDATGFVWQFGGGVNANVNERVFLGVGYRYFGGDFEEDFFNATYAYDYRTHEVLASLGVRF